MSSCLATVIVVPPMADRAPLKRVRSASLSALAEPLKSALKTCKRDGSSSPRAPCEIEPTTHYTTENAWANVPGCEGLRNAMAFLQKSRQHAMLLMIQNHWDRAMSVLEKVENASESVCSQRRKLVLQHANHIFQSTSTVDAPPKKRTVRFHDDVQVADALDMDRTASEIQSPVREEMLVLRASRAIPSENYSELWM